MKDAAEYAEGALLIQQGKIFACNFQPLGEQLRYPAPPQNATSTARTRLAPRH